VRKYIKNDINTIGYFTGATFANQLGITTQMPSMMEVTTNKESTKGRIVTIGDQKVRIKRPAIEITSKNAELLQFLEAISQIENYAESSDIEVQDTLRKYLQQKNFSRSGLQSVASVITGATAKRLIEGGLIYDFAS
jgi:predicted nucleotide-binding protein (sugar kinase/HSP70/actin superfamily)